MTMGYKIRKVREEIGMSLEELSKKSGVSQETIDKLERGAIRRTTVGILLQLSEALDRKVQDIFLAW